MRTNGVSNQGQIAYYFDNTYLPYSAFADKTQIMHGCSCLSS
ncbi:hypothetical protein PPHE_a1015 [Pseudoalteromonas phenolica O-BC30]|nr:hypothetical protein [Pseudoalteromonas phenolica O-BC30]